MNWGRTGRVRTIRMGRYGGWVSQGGRVLGEVLGEAVW